MTYRTVEQARAAGLEHPGCRHRYSVWIEGISRKPEPQGKPEDYEQRAQQRSLERQVRAWKRREAAGDPKAPAYVKKWQGELRDHVDEHGLKRRYDREKPLVGKAGTARPKPVVALEPVVAKTKPVVAKTKPELTPVQKLESRIASEQARAKKTTNPGVRAAATANVQKMKRELNTLKAKGAAKPVAAKPVAAKPVAAKTPSSIGDMRSASTAVPSKLRAHERFGQMPFIEEDAQALLNYQENSFKLNEALRAGEVPEQALKIDRTLVPAAKDFQVVRGLRGGLNDFQVGKEFQDKGYLSTTWDIDTALDFAEGEGAVLRISVPKGTMAADMNKTFGEASAFPEQQEILLARGLRMRVTAITKQYDDAFGREYNLVDVEVLRD